jgi:hypothetical protein
LGIGEQLISARWYNLEECLRTPDHAEIGPGTFFGRGTTILEVMNFCLEGTVPRPQRLVLRALCDDRLTQIACLSNAVIGQPQLPLLGQNSNSEHNQYPASIQAILTPSNAIESQTVTEKAPRPA